MTWIIDRIENDIAVCEIESFTIDIPLSALPEGVQEGDVISLSVDKAQTADRKEKIKDLMNTLFKD